MLFHWLYPLSQQIGLFNVFRYITFRSFAAFVLGMAFAIIIGKRFIIYMRKKQFGQVIRSVGPESHLKKAGTPTFGGVFIMASIFLTLAITGNFTSMPLLVTLFICLSYSLLGGLDDYLKVLKKDPAGISAKGKLIWQFTTAFIGIWAAIKVGALDTELYLPFFKGAVVDLGYFYILFGGVVIVGSSNAVNLTDGLDGLAIGPIITSATTLAVLAYLAGHKEIAGYLYIPHVDNVGELTVFAAALIGAGVGFLWYNSHPAQIFMGDVGSLPLGGALGIAAVLTKNEFLFVIIGGIFVVVALSVIIQVFYFKMTGKRVFKMAPLHHHFELLGYPETKVTVRFWIVSVLLAIVAMATMKLR